MHSIEDLLAPLRGPDAEAHYAEAVSQREHALQCAALAAADGASDAVIAAALLHDIGHLLGAEAGEGEAPRVDHRHEDIGARHLRQWFGPSVTAPVALHVDAKRYLCATEDGYHAALSSASVRSLELQGGPMSPAEVVAFEQRPHWQAAVAVRRWDDLAKVPGAATPSLDDFVPSLLDVAASGC